MPAIASAAWAQATGAMGGTVTDAATHAPIRMVLVNAEKGSGDLTGDDGSFTLKSLPAGDVKIRVGIAGYRYIETTVPIAAGDFLKRDFELHPMARITGKLSDRDTGETIFRPVRVTSHGRTVGFTNDRDHKGVFEINSLEPGDYTLDIQANGEPVVAWETKEKPKLSPAYGAVSYPTTIHLNEGEQRSVDWRLARQEAHSASGVVEFPAGMEEALLTIGFGNGDWGRVENLGVKKPGGFRIDRLVSGSYSIYVQTGAAPSGGSYGSAEITVTDHDIDGLRIRLVPSVVVSGNVRMLEDGALIPKDTGLVADLMPVEIFAGFSPFMQLNGDRFEGEVHPGAYWPEFSLPDGYAVTRILFGGADVSDRPVSVTGPGELTFVVTSKPGTIAGVVRDRNQNPVKGATVRLTSSFGDPRRSPETQSGANGEFSFRNLRPGKYRIEGAEEIEVRSGETASVTVNQ